MSLVSLADVLRYSSKYDEARKIHARVLQIRERTLGDEDLGTLKSLSSLAMVLENQGHLEEAEALNRRALAGEEGNSW